MDITLKSRIERRGLRSLAGMLLALLWFTAGVRTASAHAALISSQPAAGSVLAESPDQVVLEFTEDLDPAFTRVEVWDAKANVIVDGPGVIPSGQPKMLVLETGTLPDGTYSAVWRARSLVDGHVTSGVVGFSVGEGSPLASQLPPVSTLPAAILPPAPLDTIARWLSYLFAAMAGGAVMFGLLVWRPAYTQQTSTVADTLLGRVLRGMAFVGLSGLALTTLLFLFEQASLASGGQLSAVLLFLGTRSGILLMVRLALIALMVVQVRLLPPPGRGSLVRWGGVAAIVGAILLTFSLSSHGASSGSVLAIALDWVHLAAMTAWLGGLLPLALVIAMTRWPKPPDGLPDLRALIRRFSLIAMISVGALVITGLYAVWLHIRTLDALEATTYGRAAVTKSAIVLVLIIIGAINQQWLAPRLPARLQVLQHTMRIELALGVLVLFAAGVLTAVAPGKEALEAQEREGHAEVVSTDGVQMIFRVAPLQVGDNEYAVDIKDTRLGAEKSPATVIFRFQPKAGELGQTEAEATTTDDVRYSARGSYLTVQGTWRITVIVRRARFEDVRHVFEVPLGESVVVDGGAVATVEGPPNPIQPDSASVAEGEALYEQWCVPCHGITGKGDGPVGQSLDPPPADLTVHSVPGVHSDGQLWLWITDGFPNSAMPEFSEQLTDEQRWHLVNYIRTLGQE